MPFSRPTTRCGGPAFDRAAPACYTGAVVCGAVHPLGGMAERFIAAVLKTVDRKIRGFESLSLRLGAGYVGEVPEWTIGAAC